MKVIVLVLFLLQSVLCLHININGSEGVDTVNCFQEQVPCKSLEYVARNLNVTNNVTIEITSPSISLSGRIMFTNIIGLTLKGKGPQLTNIKCDLRFGKYSNGSGFVFRYNKNVILVGFTMQKCGLYYYNSVYYGANIQVMLFFWTYNINITQVMFNDSVGVGLVLQEASFFFSIVDCHFSNNLCYNCHDDLITAQKKEMVTRSTGNCIGGGLHIYQKAATIKKVSIIRCQFSNNVANYDGGAIMVAIDDNPNFVFQVINCTFFHNKAVHNGGAIGISVSQNPNLNINGSSISFYNCKFKNNKANRGGAMAILVPLEGIIRELNKYNITFHDCSFIDNEAHMGTAFDVNINFTHRTAASIATASIRFHHCQFVNNVAVHSSESQTNSINAVILAFTIAVEFVGNVTFINNTGTALYLVNSNAVFSFNSIIKFINNTGDKGGAIYISDYSTIATYSNSNLLFMNNTAAIGGALYASQSADFHYCFLRKIKSQTNLTFINNSAHTNLGHDIFMSSLHPCLEEECKYSIFHYFHFLTMRNSNRTTGPVILKYTVPETHQAPYPGLPYTMIIKQMDAFNNIITDLQLFPISATLLVKDSSVNISISYSIGNNYTIVFKGAVGDKGTLSLQTTDYKASLLIIITLSHCPPGYIFNNGSCHCSHSTSLYYYGVLHCVEDGSAVVSTGVWAGYLKDIFATAVCVTSLCDYHSSIISKNNNNGEHILPLNYSLLNDQVCAIHRTGVLCGSCVTDYTTYLHSPSYQCGETTHCQYGPLLYILSEIIPVTGIFLIILFFNINLTSGALYSFIFYLQIINNTLYQSFNGIPAYFFIALKLIYGIFDLDILEMDQLSFCLFKNANIMDLMLIKYLTTLYALFLIIVTILVLRFSSYSCIKLCHKCGRRNIRGSIVNGLTAFLVLCYFHCLTITLHILVPSYVMGEGRKQLKAVPLYNGDLSYMSVGHLEYVGPAIVCLIFIILPPPIILLLEPLLIRVSGLLNMRRNVVTYTLHRLRMKLKPFLDSFQGCFKDNCHCFAGLFFLYRVLVVLVPVFLPGSIVWSAIARQIILFLILFVHCLCFPFEKKWHNHLKTFLLIDLLLINTVQLAPLTEYSNDGTIFMAVFQLILMSLPLVYVMAYIGYYNCKIRVIKKKEEISSFQDDDSLPHRLLSYNTFN